MSNLRPNILSVMTLTPNCRSACQTLKSSHQKFSNKFRFPQFLISYQCTFSERSGLDVYTLVLGKFTISQTLAMTSGSYFCKRNHSFPLPFSPMPQSLPTEVRGCTIWPPPRFCKELADKQRRGSDYWQCVCATETARFKACCH